MVSIKIKTDDFINLINTKTIEISASDLQELKSKINIVPKKNGESFLLSNDVFLEEFKRVFSTYSVLFELI
ncbi:TPA: hypothetical protein ACT5CK_002365 [Flavobacterium psychrophilum]|nr:hypothetical protein [Flavobacterium psychrophilum]GEJ52798.1 hypothetical protein FPKKO176_contig00124-0005 [Flavobacterium psychrophilum]GEJ55191.1 hypothetical protein FPKHI175_contig00121-0005 [Flavobacterium psychrophilum]